MQQATEKWTSDSKNRTKVENHLSTTSNLNLNGFGSVSERQTNTKNIGQEVNELIWIIIYPDFSIFTSDFRVLLTIANDGSYCFRMQFEKNWKLIELFLGWWRYHNVRYRKYMYDNCHERIGWTVFSFCFLYTIFLWDGCLMLYVRRLAFCSLLIDYRNRRPKQPELACNSHDAIRQNHICVFVCQNQSVSASAHLTAKGNKLIRIWFHRETWWLDGTFLRNKLGVRLLS